MLIYIYIYQCLYIYVHVHIHMHVTICVFECMHTFICMYAGALRDPVFVGDSHQPPRQHRPGQDGLLLHDGIYVYICMYVCIYIDR